MLAEKTNICRAKISDLPAIVNIYNDVISEGGYTADESLFSVDERIDWYTELNNKELGIYVMTFEQDVIGYFHFSPWRKGREALKNTVELTFYLDKKHRGKGLGQTLVQKAIELGMEKGYTSLLAILLASNLRSKTLLEKSGFETAGILKDVAKIKGEKINQYIMQYRY